MRRSLVAGTAGALSSIAIVVLASCGGDEERSNPIVSADAGFDAPLLAESAPPVVDAEPPPGDVCGERGGLAAASSWPLRGGCPTRAGWSSTSGPQTAAVAWTTPANAGDTSPVVGLSSVIWVGTASGDVLALTSSGDIRCAHRTGGVVRSSPAITATGIAVVGGTDGTLYGLTTGAVGVAGDAGVDAGDAGSSYPPAKVVFSLALGPIASSPVIGGDGRIYVGTTDGKLVAVAGDGSATKWSVTTNDTFGSSPAIGQDGTIHVGSSDHHLYAISPEGSVKWALDLGAEIDASPAVGGDGSIYIGTRDGKLHAVDRAGKVRFSYATGGAIKATPAVYAGTVYIGSEDKKLHAVSTVDGSRRWAYETLGAVATPLIGPDGVVYVGAADARLYAITARGNLFFAVNVKGRVTSAPAVGHGPFLYVTTENGVVAVGP